MGGSYSVFHIQVTSFSLQSYILKYIFREQKGFLVTPELLSTNNTLDHSARVSN